MVLRGLRLLLLILVFSSIGCAGSLGREIVQTPNHGKQLGELDAHDATPAMNGAVIDHRFVVQIQQPAASLSVWVIDPSNERLIDNEQGLWFTLPDNVPRQTRPPHSTVLILHGFRHWKNDWAYLVWARFLAEHGYRAVLVDLRGHGGSTGDWSGFGPREADDLVHVVDALERRGLLAGQLGVFGGSYGGATALHFAGRDPRVEAVVTVSAFASMRQVIPAFAKAQLGWASGFIGFWGYDRIVDHAGRAGGFDPDHSDARRGITATSAHVLLLHSNADQHVPPQNAHDLAEAGGSRVERVMFDAGGHFDFGVDDAGEVRRRALAWFDRHLKPEPRPRGRR